MRGNAIYWFCTIMMVIIMVSCRKHAVDKMVPPDKVHLSVERFEHDLFSGDPSRTDSLVNFLYNRYGGFFELYTQRIISIGDTGHPRFYETFKAFITHYDNYILYKRVMQVFPDLEEIDRKLTVAFRRFLYYFPGQQVPRIITFLSGFNYSVVSDSGLIGIGLDKYLGTDEEIYSQAGLYNYLRINMHKGKIPSDCMRLWAETEFPYNDSVNNLLTNMVYQGKIMYLVKSVFPDEPDSLLWGFTGPQMAFCKANEKQMWTYLVEYKLLFKTDRFTIDKFTREGPFTTEFSRESPARASVWIGYKIVEKYMKKHKEVSMEALMKEDDYHNILTLSGYNP
ncbi:MAG: hypothetical protein JXR41_13300 [Bacteroidales bacterium]|nr:hypothetical protein [Bacteroidales bacterium]MBN2764063.1 hypothetical protein [Bacteroidales bacterium]